MEYAGMAAGITYMITTYPNTLVEWYCDNKSAVGEIPKLSHRSARQWLASSNSDIGHYMEGIPQEARNNITVTWKRGHPERRMDVRDYEIHDWMNTVCDELAGKVPHHQGVLDCLCEHHRAIPPHIPTCELHKLPNQPVRVCYMGEPIVSKMSQTVMKYIQTNYTLQHLQNTRPEWTPNQSDIDWPGYDRWNTRMKSATRRAANMKLIWDMYMTAEYVHRKFRKGDGWCRCKKAKETCTHMRHECQSEANALGREQLVYKIHRSIRKLVGIKAISPNWGWFLTQMFSLDKDGATMMWDPGSIPDWALWVQTQPITENTKQDILAWVHMGSECLWKGLFPLRLAITLRNIGMPANK